MKLQFQLMACVIHFNIFLGKAGGSRPFQRSDGIEMVFGGTRSSRFRRVYRYDRVSEPPAAHESSFQH